MRTPKKEVNGEYFDVVLFGATETYHRKDRMQIIVRDTTYASNHYSISGGSPSLTNVRLYPINGQVVLDLTDWARAQAVGQVTLTIHNDKGNAVSILIMVREGAYYPLVSQVAGYPRATIPPRTMIEQGGFANPNVVVSDFATTLHSDAPPMYEVDANVRAFTTTIGGITRLTKVIPQVCGKNYIQLQWQSLAQPDSDVVVYKRAVFEVAKITGQAEAVALSAQLGQVPNSVRGVGCKVVAVLDNLEQDDVAYYADIIYSDVVRGALAVGDDITGETMQVYIETNSVDITGGKISLTINMGEYGI